jgi:hypothetical protein
MAVFDTAHNPKNIKPIVTKYGNGNIAITSEGMVIAFWNENKQSGTIAGQRVFGSYGYDIDAVTYKTKRGWVTGVANRLRVLIEY